MICDNSVRGAEQEIDISTIPNSLEELSTLDATKKTLMALASTLLDASYPKDVKEFHSYIEFKKFAAFNLGLLVIKNPDFATVMSALRAISMVYVTGDEWLSVNETLESITIQIQEIGVESVSRLFEWANSPSIDEKEKNKRSSTIDNITSNLTLYVLNRNKKNINSNQILMYLIVETIARITTTRTANVLKKLYLLDDISLSKKAIQETLLLLNHNRLSIDQVSELTYGIEHFFKYPMKNTNPLASDCYRLIGTVYATALNLPIMMNLRLSKVETIIEAILNPELHSSIRWVLDMTLTSWIEDQRIFNTAYLALSKRKERINKCGVNTNGLMTIIAVERMKHSPAP